jgi:hypothetical protein
LRAVIEQLLDGASAPDSAADLNLDVRRAEDGLSFSSIVPAASYGVEVYDVEMTKPVLPPRRSHSQRIWNANHLLIVGASDKLHTRTAPQVKRGNCNHRPDCGIKAWIMTGEGAAFIACWRACE